MKVPIIKNQAQRPLGAREWGKHTLMEVNQSVHKLLYPNRHLEAWQVPNVHWSKKEEKAFSNDRIERDTYEGVYQGVKALASVTYDKASKTYLTRAQVFSPKEEKPAIIRSFVTNFRDNSPVRKDRTFGEFSRNFLATVKRLSATNNKEVEINAASGFTNSQEGVHRYPSSKTERDASPSSKATDIDETHQLSISPKILLPKFKLRRRQTKVAQKLFQLKSKPKQEQERALKREQERGWGGGRGIGL